MPSLSFIKKITCKNGDNTATIARKIIYRLTLLLFLIIQNPVTVSVSWGTNFGFVDLLFITNLVFWCTAN